GLQIAKIERSAVRSIGVADGHGNRRKGKLIYKICPLDRCASIHDRKLRPESCRSGDNIARGVIIKHRRRKERDLRHAGKFAPAHKIAVALSSAVRRTYVERAEKIRGQLDRLTEFSET